MKNVILKALRILTLIVVALIGVICLPITLGCLMAMVIPPELGSLAVHYSRYGLLAIFCALATTSAFRYLRRYPFSNHNYFLSYSVAFFGSALMALLLIVFNTIFNIDPNKKEQISSDLFSDNMEYLLNDNYPNMTSEVTVIKKINEYYIQPEFYKQLHIRQSSKTAYFLILIFMMSSLTMLSMWRIYLDFGFKYVLISLGAFVLLIIFSIIALAVDPGISTVYAIEKHGIPVEDMRLHEKITNLAQASKILSRCFSIFKFSFMIFLPNIIGIISIQFILLSRKINEI